MGDFLINVEAIKKRARQHIEDGAITSTYQGDRETALKLLNDALATEIVCVLRYTLHYKMAEGLSSHAVAEEFKEHAASEQEHVDMIAERITQLNGEPNYDPNGLADRAKTDYVRCETLVEMLKENLIAERVVIDIYREMILYFGQNDPTTRRMIEHILRDEEEHAEDLRNLLPKNEESALGLVG